ncbi:hypothetical protein TNCV_2873631 [Trichonephila clavipes]|nr:hypothetical protein TNCV_2873631 [Trichonephila clavipes]
MNLNQQNSVAQKSRADFAPHPSFFLLEIGEVRVLFYPGTEGGKGKEMERDFKVGLHSDLSPLACNDFPHLSYGLLLYREDLFKNPEIPD